MVFASATGRAAVLRAVVVLRVGADFFADVVEVRFFVVVDLVLVEDLEVDLVLGDRSVYSASAA